MERERISLMSYFAMVFLSVAALGTVLVGYATGAGPGVDEGALAHIFQLAVVALFPVGLVFMRTADWSQGQRIVKQLTVPALLLVAAFAILYQLEHR
jgi:hypothetical protein